MCSKAEQGTLGSLVYKHRAQGSTPKAQKHRSQFRAGFSVVELCKFVWDIAFVFIQKAHVTNHISGALDVTIHSVQEN